MKVFKSGLQDRGLWDKFGQSECVRKKNLLDVTASFINKSKPRQSTSSGRLFSAQGSLSCWSIVPGKGDCNARAYSDILYNCVLQLTLCLSFWVVLHRTTYGRDGQTSTYFSPYNVFVNNPHEVDQTSHTNEWGLVIWDLSKSVLYIDTHKDYNVYKTTAERKWSLKCIQTGRRPLFCKELQTGNKSSSWRANSYRTHIQYTSNVSYKTTSTLLLGNSSVKFFSVSWSTGNLDSFCSRLTDLIFS